MFFQLGNIIFTGLISPHLFNIDGDEAVYAEHELIGGKPRLQKTGDTLQEISFEIRFNANFCNPTEQIAALKAAKDNGTILPFLWGDGRYVNDYVVLKFPYAIDEAFADGTIVQATGALTIKEYVAYNPMEQKLLAQRKAAFAVGNKSPVIQRSPQPVTPAKAIAQTATVAKQQASLIDKLVSNIQNNTAQAAVIGNQILESVNKANQAFSTMNTLLDAARDIDAQYNQIRSNAGNVVASLGAVKALYPFTSISKLTSANTLLQGVSGSFAESTSGLMGSVIVRQPTLTP